MKAEQLAGEVHSAWLVLQQLRRPLVLKPRLGVLQLPPLLGAPPVCYPWEPLPDPGLFRLDEGQRDRCPDGLRGTLAGKPWGGGQVE